MGYTTTEVRALLKAHGLRATRPRLAVVQALSESSEPLSCTEVIKASGDEHLTLATVYRNLVRLREEGVARVVSKAHGLDHYALAEASRVHEHPHFECVDCGETTCLPSEVSPALDVAGEWGESLRAATLHFHGTCPSCAGAG